MRAGVIAAMATAVVLAASGCDESEEAPPDLTAKVFESQYVMTFELPWGVTVEDHIAHSASRGATPEQMLADLFSAFSCADYPDACNLRGPVEEAIGEVGAVREDVAGRLVLVEYEGGSLELMTVLIAGSGDGAVLIDETGAVFEGGLEDFREHNDLLESSDWMLVPERITEVSGGGGLVTVTGHTRSNPVPWVLGGIGVAVVLAIVAIARHR